MKKIFTILCLLIGITLMLSINLRAETILTLSQTTTSGYVGTNHTVTAHAAVESTGMPISNLLISFFVISGPNNSTSGTGTTDVNGDASFTYIGSGGVGSDQIQAQTGISFLVYSNELTFQWTAAAEASLELTQTTSSGFVGTTHTVKAHIVDPFNYISAGHEVRFFINSGPNYFLGIKGTANTDNNDDAYYTYTDTGGPGTDEISATTFYTGKLFGSNTLQFQWVDAPPGTTVPTLGQWGLIIFGMALLGVGAIHIMRRRGLYI
jgi:hypothetical protein